MRIITLGHTSKLKMYVCLAVLLKCDDFYLFTTFLLGVVADPDIPDTRSRCDGTLGSDFGLGGDIRIE